MPERIQLRRAKGWRKPEGAVVVTRGTDWGNPFRIGDTLTSHNPHVQLVITRDIAIGLFRAWVIDRGFTEQIRSELAGRDLACWCRLDQPCHADVLLRFANGCPHGDPYCPCQDGDTCHYEGTDPFPCPHCKEIQP